VDGLDTAASEDVFQDVFAALLTQLRRIQRPDRLRSWLLTTAHRISQRRRGKTAGAPLPESLPVDDPPGEPVSRLERQHLVMQALDELGGRCQELLEALFFSPNPVEYDQVARDLNMPMGSVGPTRARCLAKLLAILQRLES
jgi:RNA polymerase sigma factor (sigma-70 family)